MKIKREAENILWQKNDTKSNDRGSMSIRDNDVRSAEGIGHEAR